MSKKIITLLLCLCAMLCYLTGCGKNDSSEKISLKDLKVTYVKAPLNIPSIIDKENRTLVKGFEKENVKVSFPEITSGAKQTEALASGDLNICSALGGTSAIIAASNGVDVKIISIYSRAPKAFNIMVKDPSIKKIADLKGKRVVGPKGTILHQILAAALAKNNLTLNDVQFRSIGIPAGVNALVTGSADAALVAGPQVLRAQKAGARILTNGEGLVDATIVIAADGKFLKEHPEAAELYMKLHKENLDFYKKYPEKSYEIAAKETGLSIDEVKLMAPWYDFSPAIDEKDIADLEATQQFLLDNKMQKNAIDIKSIIKEIK